MDEHAEAVVRTKVRASEDVRAPALAAQAELDRPRLLAREADRQARRALHRLDPVRDLDRELEPLDGVALQVERQRHDVALERSLDVQRAVYSGRGALSSPSESASGRAKAAAIATSSGRRRASAPSNEAPTSPA